MSFRVIFVVTRSTAPPNGELLGDVLYVSAPDGYRNIVYKVKHMMGLVRDGVGMLHYGIGWEPRGWLVGYGGMPACRT